MQLLLAAHGREGVQLLIQFSEGIKCIFYAFQVWHMCLQFSEEIMCALFIIPSSSCAVRIRFVHDCQQ